LADLALPRRLALPALRSTTIEWLLAHREAVALVSLMAIAAGLRFWGLDWRAVHHDESLHAQYTYYLYNADGYRHDPLMHGPFLFHTGTLIYFLFGDSDYTMRILPAIFGTVLVGMPYLLRKQIGMPAVLIAAVLLTFSPTLLYFSRFYRNELYIAVFTLGIVICIWRYLEDRKMTYLYALAALLALSFSSKEVTFITAAVILLFLDLMLAVEIGRRRPHEDVSRGLVIVRTLALIPVAWLVAAAWPLLGRHPLGLERMPAVGDVLVVMGTLTLPQFAAAVQVLPFVGDDGYNVASESTLKVTTTFVLLIACAYFGMLWRPGIWLIVAACFFVPYVLLYTTFFTNQPAIWTGDFWRGEGGFWSGIWGSLDYWLGQHHVQRGSQPVYYYALMTPLYEFLPMLLAFAGAVWLILRGDSFRRWLLFWFAGLFIGLSVAGEKMPWLEVHIVLPLAIAAAIALAAAIEALGLNGRRWLGATAGATLTAAALLLVIEGRDTFALQLAGLAIGAGLLGWTAGSFLNGGRQALGRAALVIAVAAMLTLTVRAGLAGSFWNEGERTEILVYAEVAPDAHDLRDRIDALAEASGLGHNLPIVVDGQMSWPWVWYLRHYHSVSYANFAQPDYRPPENAVLIIEPSRAAAFQTGDSEQVPYRHYLWFDNGLYLNLTLGDVAAKLTSLDSLESLGDFFLHRLPANRFTTSSGVVSFPASLAPFDTERAPPLPPPEPERLDDGRIILGRRGSTPGELLQPANLHVDGEGNIWVADSRNHRIQKFDPAGNLLGVLGKGGTEPGSFNEPWSVAVDVEGFIYVADTWNHRLQKFSPSFEFIATWGQPGSRSNPGPLDLFGPRDIVVAADGSLWVTDTGNKRLLHYSDTGEPLGSFGSQGDAPGSFNEPVGLSYDAQGRLYVADAWNARIQRFDADLSNATSFPTGWSSQDVVAKPYVTVLTDGRIIASDPGKGLLLLLDRDGQPSGLWRPETDSQPLGVVALSDGGFAFSDVRRNQVQIVPAALISTLFK
jgi:predicted membrane-bound mannosyltransferase/sugar lactone lactonase YvrE